MLWFAFRFFNFTGYTQPHISIDWYASLLWFAFRFFNFTGYTQHHQLQEWPVGRCDLLSDFLTLRDIHNPVPLLEWVAYRCDLLSDFLTLRDIHNLKLYMWLILNGLACVVQRKNPAMFSSDFFIMYLFFGSYKSYSTGSWRRPSQKSNIPQRESRIRFWPCIEVRSILVSRGLLGQPGGKPYVLCMFLR